MPTKRKQLSKTARFELFKRDGFVCQYCGAHPPHVILHIDHIVAVSKGGDSSPENLITACDQCNIGKATRDISVVPQSLREKAKLIAEQEKQILGYQSVIQGKRDRIHNECWRVISTLFPYDKDISKSDFQSVRIFIERLGFYETLDAAEKAAAKFGFRPFRYFCGICWRKLKTEAEHHA